MPRPGSRTSSSTASSRTGKWIAEALLMFSLPILMASRNAISSRGSPAGLTPCDSPNGRKTAKSGPGRRLANRSHTQENKPRSVMIGIYGPTYTDSSPPEGPLLSLENRLRQRLGCIGSTESLMTWKQSATPAGRLYSRLVPSMPRTVEIVSTSQQGTHTHTHSTSRSG